MASDLTKYLGNKIVRYLAGEAMPTPPAGIFMSLHVGDPKASGTDVTTQIRTAGRIQLAVTAPAESDTVNSMPITADADYGDAVNAVTGVSHLAIWDSQAGGKMLASKAIPGGAINIAQGAGVKFNAGDLSFVIGS